MRAGAWHIVAEGGRGNPVRIPAPRVSLQPPCLTYGNVEGYGAMCFRASGHTGRHASYAGGLIRAVWP